MTGAGTFLSEDSRAANLPLRTNPAIVTGIGDFGGAALHLLANRLASSHPVWRDVMGWLWLDPGGWHDARQFPKTKFGPASGGGRVGASDPLDGIRPEPLAKACNQAMSQATAALLRRAGYDVSRTLDVFVLAHMNDLFAQKALWPVLDLLRAQVPAHESRVTLIVASDSRYFGEASTLALQDFLVELDLRLLNDQANPAPGTIAWCYLCDTLNVDAELVRGDEENGNVVAIQAELVGSFLALLIGSDLRRDRDYVQTAISDLARATRSSTDGALIATFGWGALALPVDQVFAIARDRLASRLHRIIFPRDETEVAREAAWRSQERLLTAFDLAPQELHDWLRRGHDGALVCFDTGPPDLASLEPAAAVEALEKWWRDLETGWADDVESPATEISRSSDALLGELSEGIRHEVGELVGGDPRGVQRALAFLDSLPRVIEDARVETLADDRYYRKRTVPALDEKLAEMADVLTGKQRRLRRHLILWSLVCVAVLVLVLGLMRDLLWIVLVLWGAGMLVALGRELWRRQRGLAELQREFIAAVQFRFDAALEREIRVKRRAVFDALLAVVRQERAVLLPWKQMIAQARALLTEDRAAAYRPVRGEQLLCEPGDFPMPVAEYDEARLVDVAQSYLGHAEWNEQESFDASTIVAWLQEGAARALEDWRRGIGILDWSGLKPSQAIRDLAQSIHPQWPLGPDERPQRVLGVVGMPKRDRRLMPRLESPGRVVVVSTHDPARWSYAVMYHGLPLKTLRATQSLWEALEEERE